jgi:hypothetical protein
MVTAWSFSSTGRFRPRKVVERGADERADDWSPRSDPEVQVELVDDLGLFLSRFVVKGCPAYVDTVRERRERDCR